VRVIWSPSSLREIVNIYNYIANYNPMAARGLLDGLIAAGDSLESFQHRGRIIKEDLRELTVVYPYIIRYEIKGDEVRVLRVRHGMRQK